MSDPNTQIKLAKAVTAITNSLNSYTSNSVQESWQKLRDYLEEIEKSAKQQTSKAYGYFISALAAPMFYGVGKFYQAAKKPIGDILVSSSKATPQIANFWSSLKDSANSICSATAKIAEAAAQRISQELSSKESIMSRISDHVAKLLSKEV